MSFRLFATLVFALAAPLAAAPVLAATAQCPQSVDVRNVMTVTQYDRAGLNKLDKKEIAALNAWLTRYLQKFCTKPTPNAPPPRNASANAGAIPAAEGGNHLAPSAQHAPKQTAPGNTASAQESSFGNPPKAKKQEPGRIESRIVGQFHGWTGNTIFRLKNGQVWKQAGPGYFRIDLKSPKVVIKKLLIGHVLLVEGYGKEVFVRRIR